MEPKQLELALYEEGLEEAKDRLIRWQSLGNRLHLAHTESWSRVKRHREEEAKMWELLTEHLRKVT